MGVAYLPGRGPDDDNGAKPPEPPDDMEARIAKLESVAEKTSDRLAALERDVAVIRSNYCTREDLHREMHATTWKIVIAIVLAQLLPALPGMLRAFKLIT